jgi:hypothetical protein
MCVVWYIALDVGKDEIDAHFVAVRAFEIDDDRPGI